MQRPPATRRCSAFLASLALSVLFASCVTHDSGHPDPVDDALLSEVSTEQMEPIKQARVARDNANDALAKARRDSAWADDRARLAGAELASQIKLVHQAEMAASMAERNGTTTELAAAKERLEYVTATTDAKRAELALRKREAELRRRQEKLALERSQLAMARLDDAKAQAIQGLDRVSARKVPVREYQKQVRFHGTEVELADVLARAASDAVAEAQRDYDEALAAVPQKD